MKNWLSIAVVMLLSLLSVQQIMAQTYYENSYFSAKQGDFEESYFPYTRRAVYMNNNTKFVIAHEGDTYAAIAREVNLSDYDIRKFNDVVDWQYEPASGEVVYLMEKQTKSKTQFHTIVEGETLRAISQRYALQLKVIFKNNMKLGILLSDMRPGDRICISCK